MRIAVLTSGGDAPGMNAAIHTVVKVALARRHEVLGIRRGYKGLMAGDAVPFGLKDADGISRFGGTVLGSARSAEFLEEAGRQRAADRLAELGIEGLVVIGGNGSLTGAHLLAPLTDCQVVGLPASIDNDIGHCGMAIGVDTALNTIVEACDRISDTARAHRRAFIVEVMGRDSGFLAMRAGLAAEADAILFAERGWSEDEVVERLLAVLHRSFSPERDKNRVLIVKAEGVRIPTARLVSRLQKGIAGTLPDLEIRETVLGHVVRGGNPSAMDRVIAQRLAFGAVLALEHGADDVMVSWEPPGDAGEATFDRRVRRVALAEVIEETRRVIDGSSPVVAWRRKLLEQVEELIAL